MSSRFNCTIKDALRLAEKYCGPGNPKIVNNRWLDYEEVDTVDNDADAERHGHLVATNALSGLSTAFDRMGVGNIGSAMLKQ